MSSQRMNSNAMKAVVSHNDDLAETQEYSNSENYIEATEGMPRIPKQFKHLYLGLDSEKYEVMYKPEHVCDCGKQQGEYKNCPHFVDPAFQTLFEVLPKRLAHIDFVNSENKSDIRMKLFVQVMTALEQLPCEPVVKLNKDVIITHQNETVGKKNKKSKPLHLHTVHQAIQRPERECHIHRDLKKMFAEEWEELFNPKPKVEQNNKRCGTIMINLSFLSSFVLLFIIVIAVVISRSMSILATAMDLVLEILSGIVLFIATRLAAKGIKNGQYQHTLHENDNNVKYIYARRYESLGVLGFSCIMGTCSIGLGGECLIQIVEILKGDYHPVVVFNALPMTIVLVTIFLKIFLLIGCQIAANRNPHNPDSYLAYRDDHRNDILTNTLGFLGATLAYYLKGKWCYCDPIASFILCMYIMFSWGSSAVEQMKQLAGHRTEEKVMDEMMVRLINQMPCSIYITAVEGFIGYSSGQQNVYEIRINVQNNITLAKGHDICQQIQNTFEETPGVERCYVHIETDECINEFE
ncbi:Cation_efflux family protein [Hexamita inflata]|uniref:Cation efflux family protein n=1 Tax=Hexamita inflata TaxID=28002 RepID=A0AA86NN18_9EUKA|nr:Cation efflux family protein [Hexamita inflata]